jgi:hypothetical protein
MTSTSAPKSIEVVDAVNQKIVREKESHAVASVTKIGEGGYSDVYKICTKNPSSHAEESTGRENPLRVPSPTFGP